MNLAIKPTQAAIDYYSRITPMISESELHDRIMCESISARDRCEAHALIMQMNESQWAQLGVNERSRSYRMMLVHIANPANETIGCGIIPHNIVHSLARSFGVKL